MTIAVVDSKATRLLGHEFARPALLAEALTHPSALAAMQKGQRKVRHAAVPRDYERLAQTLAGFHYLAFACLMLHRLIPMVSTS